MKIINIDDVRTAAFELGFGRFKDMDPVDPETFDVSHFTETAEYANNVAPILRQLSGFGDVHGGTYQKHRDVLVINQDEADELAADAGFIDADMIWSPELFDDIHDSWLEGVYEAVELAAAKRPAE
ncbi:hypothetical protein M1M38_gp099 [Halorubrum tailed virus 27]|uniref:Uncharacterized protein n=1 Tax=Halorubrum tailed virus 27 TaxID=2878008 RepID=A0AAE8XZ24_9CAUD|nr:hypothetical protein M1M38_gp099 [Halorubrum tailed virus 27]UBF22792.1 hypothetical protein HRTV-27_gp99 [Halorubrum tailed virus 27]